MTNTAAPDWIPIDQKLLREYQTSRAGGVQTLTAPSPYDLPDAVAVDVDLERNVILIRFRYLEPERTDSVPVRKDVTLHVGRFTQRLYGLEITVQNLRKPDAIRRGLDSAVEAITSYVPKQRKANFRAAREAVESSADRLARAAAVR